MLFSSARSERRIIGIAFSICYDGCFFCRLHEDRLTYHKFVLAHVEELILLGICIIHLSIIPCSAYIEIRMIRSRVSNTVPVGITCVNSLRNSVFLRLYLRCIQFSTFLALEADNICIGCQVNHIRTTRIHDMLLIIIILHILPCLVGTGSTACSVVVNEVERTAQFLLYEFA